MSPVLWIILWVMMTIVFGCGAKWLGSKHAEDKYCDEIVQESDDELIDAADADALEFEVF